jgi:hypothetical protein
MHTMQPTLLTGPSDWDAERMPRSEFVERIEALWQSHPQAERAIVFGNSMHHAELAYFTNFVPKLDAAVALLSRSHERQLLVGGGPNMMGAARPLTFIENVAPLRDVAGTIRANPTPGHTLLIGADYMPTRVRAALTEAVGPAAVLEATAAVWAEMARKSAREIEAMRAAGAAKGAGVAAMMEAVQSGEGVSAVIAAGEEAAYAEGAQDVRTLFSRDGGKTYRPFLGLIEKTIDALPVYMAVRRFNYWSDGFALPTRRDDEDPVLAKAISARAAALRLIKAGTPVSEVAIAIRTAIEPCTTHPMVARAMAQRIGLALDEGTRTEPGPTFEDGEVHSLRIGATDGMTRHQVVSAMIRVRAGGCDLL